MLLRLLVLILMFAFSFALPAFAGQLEDAIEAYKRNDYDTVLKLLRPLAEQGNADAQSALGLMCTQGQGVPLDYVEAAKWFNLAISRLPDKSNDKYWAWSNWRSDIESKMTPAQITEAQKRARLLSPAMSAVAWQLEDGHAALWRGDYETAHKLFLPLAEQGNADAQSALGRMYAHGSGVPQDYTEAVKWYRMAAEQGNADAQSALGRMYEDGYGVPQDYTEALKWYRKPAEQGNADAQYKLAGMYFEEAVKWCTKSAEQGNGQAQGALGVIYAIEGGGKQDLVEAYKWYTLAVARDPHPADRDLAIHNRNTIAAKMTPAQIAEAQKRASEWKPTKEPAK